MNWIAFISLLILIAIVFIKVTKNKKKIFKIYFCSLLVIHYVTFYLNFTINLKIKKDSYVFYNRALEADSILDFSFLGSQFISVITYPLAKLGLSYFVVSFCFATIGFLTFINYTNYLISNYNVQKSKILIFILLLFLIPSLHFWTAGLTKEVFVFYFMSIIFFHTVKTNFISIPLIISLIFILLIRPYLFGIILLSYIVFILLNNKMNKKNKIVLILLSFLGMAISLPILKGFLRLDSFNFDDIQKNFQKIVVYSQNNGDSSIDLENSTYFYRMFLVLFKPIFYDAKTVFQYLTSIENLVTAIIIFKFIFEVIKMKAHKLIFKEQVFLSLTTILLILFFSSYLYNLGLASRMRVMFMPYLYLLIFAFYAEIKNLRI